MSAPPEPASRPSPAAATEVLICCAEEDISFREELSEHLQPLIDRGFLRLWHEGRIQGGADIANERNAALDRAGLVLAIVTVHFLNSSDCNAVVEQARQRATAVVPVLSKPCLWKVSELASFSPLPANRQPISTWEDANLAWLEVVRGVLAKVEELSGVRLEGAPDLAAGGQAHPAASANGSGGKVGRRRGRLGRQVAIVAAVVGALAALGVLRVRMARRPDRSIAHEGGEMAMGSTEVEASELLGRCARAEDEATCRKVLEREVPAVRVLVLPFFLDVDEVTNEELVGWLRDQNGLSVAAAEGMQAVRLGDQVLAGLADADFPFAGLRAAGSEPLSIEVVAGFEKKPAVAVTWTGAAAYCRASGKRLPTEAEWEHAARVAGGDRPRSYPWGEDEPSCETVVFGRCPAAALEQCGAGLFPCAMQPRGPMEEPAPLDSTPRGVRALGGNVHEWVMDTFDPARPGHTACSAPPCRDPGRHALARAAFRVVRGGGWNEPAFYLRATRRAYLPEGALDMTTGFRCARGDEERR